MKLGVSLSVTLPNRYEHELRRKRPPRPSTIVQHKVKCLLALSGLPSSRVIYLSARITPSFIEAESTMKRRRESQPLGDKALLSPACSCRHWPGVGRWLAGALMLTSAHARAIRTAKIAHSHAQGAFMCPSSSRRPCRYASWDRWRPELHRKARAPCTLELEATAQSVPALRLNSSEATAGGHEGTGSASLGRPHTAESRARISAANKGKTPWNKGIRHSEETKRKIAERTRAAMVKRKEATAASMVSASAEHLAALLDRWQAAVSGVGELCSNNRALAARRRAREPWLPSCLLWA